MSFFCPLEISKRFEKAIFFSKGVFFFLLITKYTIRGIISNLHH